MVHRSNSHQLHPILRKFCPSLNVIKDISPSHFFYPPKSHRRLEANSVPDLEEIGVLVPNVDPYWSLQSKKVTVRDQSFQIDDNVVLMRGDFIKITEILTVRSNKQLTTLVTGKKYQKTGNAHAILKKDIYQISSINVGWSSQANLKKFYSLTTLALPTIPSTVA